MVNEPQDALNAPKHVLSRREPAAMAKPARTFLASTQSQQGGLAATGGGTWEA